MTRNPNDGIADAVHHAAVHAQELKRHVRLQYERQQRLHMEKKRRQHEHPTMTEDMQQEAASILEPWMRPLRSAFRSYARSAATLRKRNTNNPKLEKPHTTMTLSEWISLARAFHLVPQVLTTTDATSLFHRCNLSRAQGPDAVAARQDVRCRMPLHWIAAQAFSALNHAFARRALTPPPPPIL